MRDIKFRVWDKSRKEILSDVRLSGMLNKKFQCENLVFLQFTGLKDKNGVDIYEGDLVNIFYTSKSGEFVFDGIYSAIISPSGVAFNFVKLLWECGGRNQYPYEKANFTDYGFVRGDYKNNSNDLRPCIAGGSKWEYSNYFEVIGNIYENPELLK